MKFKKKIQAIVFALFMTTFVNAQNKPASPAAVATGKINGVNISINYSKRTFWRILERKLFRIKC